MASLGHIAVGLAAGRAHAGRRAWAPMLVFSALSLLPDADVVAFALRVPYSAPYGHRGATHSLAFAALVGLGAWLVRRDRRTALVVALTVVTHPLLDALTDGGLGVALLFPFSNARYFAPFTPLPVAPIGAHLWSARGLYVVLVEAVAFLPCWAWALRPGPRASAPR